MPQFLTDFANNIGESVYVLALHAGLFFLLFWLTDKNTSGKYANFRRVDNDDGFLNEDFKTDISYFFFNKLVTAAATTYFITIFSVTVLERYFPSRIFEGAVTQWPFPIQLIVGLLIADAAFFFPHWFSHKFLWRFHSIHHSAEKITWITAMRLHPVDQVPFAVGGAIFMHILGFESESIIYALILHNAYNLFVHANISIDFPKPFCYILGSPNYHRWHHAADKEAIDKNFATMFPVFDLIFGSYYYPMGRLPEKYGLAGDDQKEFPKRFREQMIYPFKRKRKMVRDDGIEPPTHSV